MQAGGVNAHELLERVAFTAQGALHERLLATARGRGASVEHHCGVPLLMLV